MVVLMKNMRMVRLVPCFRSQRKDHAIAKVLLPIWCVRHIRPWLLVAAAARCSPPLSRQPEKADAHASAAVGYVIGGQDKRLRKDALWLSTKQQILC